LEEAFDEAFRTSAAGAALEAAAQLCIRIDGWTHTHPHAHKHTHTHMYIYTYALSPKELLEEACDKAFCSSAAGAALEAAAQVRMCVCV